MEVWKSAVLVGANSFTLLILCRGGELWTYFTRNIVRYDSPSTGLVLVCLEATFWVLERDGGARRVMKARNWLWRIDSELKLYWLRAFSLGDCENSLVPVCFSSVILTAV
jgi:hypothetical protein